MDVQRLETTVLPQRQGNEQILLPLLTFLQFPVDAVGYSRFLKKLGEDQPFNIACKGTL